MSATRELQPFAVLREIEARSRENAFGLPQQVEVRKPWSGIGFRVGEQRLVSGLGEIGEILRYPDLTRVPGAQAWVRGVANIRGSLIPILDLKGFISGINTELKRRSRVLIIERDDLTAGLLVDEAMGMRHFFEEEETTDLPQVDELLETFLKGAYRQGDLHWGIFDVGRLVEHPKFYEVAAHG
jgi:twitching motility protein PilI